MKAQIYFDGGIKPFPTGGYAYCYGWVVKIGGKTVSQGRDIEFAPEDSGSCVAEFGALSRALRDSVKVVGKSSDIEIFGDSQSVMGICAGSSAIHSGRVAALKSQTDVLIEQMAASSIRFTWLPRESNSDADRLGREAFAAASAQDLRIQLMNKLNSLARRYFGDFYDGSLMSMWSESITGKRKLAKMSVAELKLLLARVSQIPNFIMECIQRCSQVQA